MIDKVGNHLIAAASLGNKDDQNGEERNFFDLNSPSLNSAKSQSNWSHPADFLLSKKGNDESFFDGLWEAYSDAETRIAEPL